MTPTLPASTHVVQAIQNETRLFQALRDALRQQRAAVAASDPGALDAWTTGIARLLREIEAADGYRQKILAALVDRQPAPGKEAAAAAPAAPGKEAAVTAPAPGNLATATAPAPGNLATAGSPALSRHPLVARARLVFTRAVREAANELAINRTVMARAIEYGDGLLRTVMAGPNGAGLPARGYGRTAAPRPAATLLLNRVV